MSRAGQREEEDSYYRYVWIEYKVGGNFGLRVYPRIREIKSHAGWWTVVEVCGGPKLARARARERRALGKGRTYAVRRRSARRWEVVELDQISRRAKRPYGRPKDVVRDFRSQKPKSLKCPPTIVTNRQTG